MTTRIGEGNIEAGLQTRAGDTQQEMPWQERPRNCDQVVWRFSRNPVVRRDPFPTANRVLPCAALTDDDTGSTAIDYGCADTVTRLCFSRVDDVLEFLRHHSAV